MSTQLPVKVLADQVQQDEMLRKIFAEHFELPTNEEVEGRPDKIGQRAWTLMAIEVALSCANMVIAMNRPESGRSFRSIQDLLYVLNSNDFWVKNGPVLVPVMAMACNAHKDGVAFKLDAIKNQEYTIYDKLTSATTLVPLEIFSMLLYLVGGPMLMATRSMQLKLALAPYLVS